MFLQPLIFKLLYMTHVRLRLEFEGVAVFRCIIVGFAKLGMVHRTATPYYRTTKAQL